MNAQERREEILRCLTGSQGPVSASALASRLGVSRQIVVGDIALLRAAGTQIDATPRGYVTQHQQGCYHGLVACCHDRSEGLRQELYIIVDNGGICEDVIVENPLYGEITGRLHLVSRYDVDVFVQKAQEQPDCLLSHMTGGVHLHTLLCPDKETFDRICRGLAEKGFLYDTGASAK